MQRTEKEGTRLKKLLVYMKEYKKESILGPLFKLLEATFELLVPLVTVSYTHLFDNMVHSYFDHCTRLLFF